MSEGADVSGLQEMLDVVEGLADDRDEVSLDEVLDVVGRSTFSPWLLLAGLIIMAPILGDIPGVPTVVGLAVIVAAVQLLFGRDHFWLPGWLLRRKVERKRLRKILDWLEKPAGFVDRLLKPRLQWLVTGPAVYVIGSVCVLLSASFIFMELVPFSANLGGAALAAFGLALLVRDGLLGLIAFVLTTGTFVVIAVALL